MRTYFFLWCVILLQCKSSLQKAAYDTSTLKQAHVVFRHGDRTPDTYCKHLIKNSLEDYWPAGFGALTLLGKKQEYDIGVSLRERYNSWLGDTYYPDVLDAISTDYPRTKMSINLVLAGLWRPAVEQIWNWELDWQPIPYSYLPSTNLLLGYPLYCPNYVKLYNATLNTAAVQRWLKPTQRLTDYISNNANMTESTGPTGTTLYIYACLFAMEKTNGELPRWTKRVYPSAIERVAPSDYILKTYNDVLMQYTGGQLLNKILDDSQAKIVGKLVPAERKLFLYSGHEYNVAFLLRALNSFDPHVPPYGSYVIVELHKIQQTYGYKIFYQNYRSIEPSPVVIPGCAQFCPIADFIKILGKYLPGSKTVC